MEEEGVPDEEGWVKVTRKGRRPGLPRTEAANLRALEREKRKKARKELLNFYAWQHRETKRERELSLFLSFPIFFSPQHPSPNSPCLSWLLITSKRTDESCQAAISQPKLMLSARPIRVGPVWGLERGPQRNPV